jgi:hypothetical protein
VLATVVANETTDASGLEAFDDAGQECKAVV